MTRVKLVRVPSDEDLMWVKECTLVTVGKEPATRPTTEWLHKLLKARHSPIREMWYHFRLEDIPYYVQTHLVRHHVEFHPYVKSQRNDRQDEYDRRKAPQDTPVTMCLSLNAEALLNLANKRLCMLADPETRSVVSTMCWLVEVQCPEFAGLLVPACEYHHECKEMFSCGRYEKNEKADLDH